MHGLLHVPYHDMTRCHISLALTRHRLLHAPDRRRRKVTIECTLIAGINDGLEDADLLATFLQPVVDACHDDRRNSKRTGVLINLIPYNPSSSSSSSLPHQAGSYSIKTATQGPSATFDPSLRRLPHHSLFRRPERVAVEAFQARELSLS